MEIRRGSLVVCTVLAFVLLLPGVSLGKGLGAGAATESDGTWTIALYVDADCSLEMYWEDPSLPYLLNIPASDGLNIVAIVDWLSEDGVERVEISGGSCETVETYPEMNFGEMSRMVSDGRVWAGASQDYDALLFGTTNLVRNLTLAGKRRLPSGKTQDVVPELVSLREVLSALGITREQLVDMAILIGTDFNDGVRGVGPKRALAAIRRTGSLERLSEEGKVTVPEEYDEVRRIFLEPETVTDYSLEWKKPDNDRVRRIMCDSHGFSVDRIDAVLSRLSPKGAPAEQFRLDKWS